MTRRAALLASGPLLAAGIALISGCENRGYYHGLPRTWPISIDNRSGVTLDIHLDGRFVLTVTDATTGTIQDVDQASHQLQAYDRDGRLRAERSFYLDREFVWLLE